MRYLVLLFLIVAARAQQLTPAQHFALAKLDVAKCQSVAESVTSAKTLARIMHEALRGPRVEVESGL